MLVERAQVAGGVGTAAQCVGEGVSLTGKQCADDARMLAELCGKDLQLVRRQAVVPQQHQTVAAERLCLSGKLLCHLGEQLFILGGKRLLFLRKLGLELFDIGKRLLRLAGKGRTNLL